jgi:hypothetical protein
MANVLYTYQCTKFRRIRLRNYYPRNDFCSVYIGIFLSKNKMEKMFHVLFGFFINRNEFNIISELYIFILE